STTAMPARPHNRERFTQSLRREARVGKAGGNLLAQSAQEGGTVGAAEQDFALALRSQPHWTAPKLIALVTWEQMPMDVSFLIAEAVVVHLPWPHGRRDRFRRKAHVIE